MEPITEYELVCFHNTYMVLDLVKDPHELFSYKLGVTRQEAKKRCHQIMYSLPFVAEYVTCRGGK